MVVLETLIMLRAAMWLENVQKWVKFFFLKKIQAVLDPAWWSVL